MFNKGTHKKDIVNMEWWDLVNHHLNKERHIIELIKVFLVWEWDKHKNQISTNQKVIWDQHKEVKIKCFLKG